MEARAGPQDKPEIERRLARLEAYEEVSRAIGASLDLGEICLRALEATLRVVAGQSGTICVVEWDSRQIKTIASIGFAPEFLEKFGTLPLDERSLTGCAVLSGRPQLGGIGRLPPISRRIAALLGTRNSVVVPISSRGKVLGTLNVTFDPGRKASAEELELMANIAAPIGIAMDNAQLYAQSVELNTRLITTSLRLQSLIGAAEDVNSRLEFSEVLHKIVELAARITGATEGIPALREEDRVVMHEWWDGRNWRPFEFAWEKGHGGPGWAFETSRPYMTNEAPTDPHVAPELLSLMKLKNFIVAPMLGREGEFLGIVEVDNKVEGQPFTEDDLQLVTAFSRLAAVALQNATLMRDVASTKDLLQTMIDNASAYINYLDKDFIVRRVSRKTADFFGIPPEELLGRNVFEVLPWLKEHEVAESLAEAVRTGRRQELMEVHLALPSGPYTYWDITFVPTKDQAGRVTGVFSYSTEVTDKVEGRKVAEARARQQKAVAEVALAVNSKATLQDVLRTAADRMVEVLHAYGGAIFLLDPTGRRILIEVSTGVLAVPIGSVEVDLRDAPATRQALEERQPIFFGREETTPKSRHYFDELEIVKVLGVPLLAAGKPIGVVFLTYSEPRPQPSPEELDFAISLANQCAIAIDKARLLDEARTERARLESVIEQMPEGIVIASAPDGLIVLLNRRAREITGEALKIGMHVGAVTRWISVRHPDGRPYRPEELTLYRALFLGEVVPGEEQIIRQASGEEIFLLARAVPLRDESGRIREAMLVLQDTTPLKEAQRRAEEAASSAQRQKAETDAVIETLAEGVLITDPSGNIVRANRAAATILGFKTFEETYPRIEDYRFLDLCDPQGRPLPLEEWPVSRAMRGESFTEQEVIATTADDRRIHLLAGGSCVCGPRGEAVLAIIVFRDITAIRSLERQREEFISVIAHDLRAALTVVRGYAQILLSPRLRDSMPTQALRPLEAIGDSTGRLDKMVTDLLDVSRIEARRLRLEKRQVNLAELVRSVVDRTTELTKGHAVRVEVKEAVSPVLADPDRIEQVLNNLLSNASKYSFPDTPITVEVEPRPGEVMVSVTNLGVGIRPEDIPRLFTRFHRAEAATREKVPGLGLGLYISKGLIEAHNGRIWVDSEPGKYATFRFTLPVARASARGPVPSPRGGELV